MNKRLVGDRVKINKNYWGFGKDPAIVGQTGTIIRQGRSKDGKRALPTYDVRLDNGSVIYVYSHQITKITPKKKVLRYDKQTTERQTRT